MGWSKAAGLSPRYITVNRSRSRTNPDYRLSERGAEALARVADVSVMWLRTGVGHKEPSRSTRPVGNASAEQELALLDAYRAGGVPAEAVLDARGLLHDLDPALVPDRATGARVLRRLLTVVARLRAAGQVVNWATIAWNLLAEEKDT